MCPHRYCRISLQKCWLTFGLVEEIHHHQCYKELKRIINMLLAISLTACVYLFRCVEGELLCGFCVITVNAGFVSYFDAQEEVSVISDIIQQFLMNMFVRVCMHTHTHTLLCLLS
jgi:hypothetical protein